MGDPVSSVAYAMEAGLRSLGGHLVLLLPTMAVVLAVIVLVAVNYHQLYAMFPEGGGDAAASVAAFSEGLAFVPLAALMVDYALTIAISAAAGASEGEHPAGRAAQTFGTYRRYSGALLARPRRRFSRRVGSSWTRSLEPRP